MLPAHVGLLSFSPLLLLFFFSGGAKESDSEEFPSTRLSLSRRLAS